MKKTLALLAMLCFAGCLRTTRYRLTFTDNPEEEHARACYSTCAMRFAREDYRACLAECPGGTVEPLSCERDDRLPDVACDEEKALNTTGKVIMGGAVVAGLGVAVWYLVKLFVVNVQSETQDLGK
jgi:hypothetical protein